MFDYLPQQTLLVTLGELEPAVDQFLADADYRYDQRRVDPLRPLLEPKELWLTKDEMHIGFKQLPRVRVQQESVDIDKADRFNPALTKLPELTINHQLKEPLAELRRFTEQFTGKVIFLLPLKVVEKHYSIFWLASNYDQWFVPT